MKQQHPFRRPASAYLIVLGSATLVTVLGLSALLAQRIHLRIAQNEVGMLSARLHALSAIEMGLGIIEDDPAWRSNLTSGTWASDVPLGTGTFTITGVDPVDGDLSDSTTDPVILTGIGVEGGARHIVEVRLVTRPEPLSCLEVAMQTDGMPHFNSSRVFCDQIISANAQVDAWAAQVNADVETTAGFWGWSYNGAQTTGIDARVMPDNTVLDYYTANGTTININSLPSGGGNRRLERVVLSPAVNPYGATNAEGIYVIDCLNQSLQIRRCRIVGTLVILNPGWNSIIEQELSWEPAIPNYPALLVSGDMEFRVLGDDLDEDNEGVNFNPPGTPYQTTEDGDTDDVYPSVIKGIVYVRGEADSYEDPHFEGVVIVGGDFWVQDNLTLTYSPNFFNDPPPGFQNTSAVDIVPGTWRQVVE